MGEVAEAMLDGTLCAGCGEYLGRDLGFPQYCSGCGDPLAESPVVVNRGRKREPDGQSALPRFNRYSIPPRAGSTQCKFCRAWIMPSGIMDHMRAKHPDKIKELKAMRQFLACAFKAGGRPYSYHNDGEPRSVGDIVKVEGRHGVQRVEVVEILPEPPPFQTKPILGLADLASAAGQQSEEQ